MKHTIVYIILSLIAFTSIASAATVEPITEFVNVTSMNVSIQGDRIHKFEYTIVSTNAIDMAVNFTIKHDRIENDEWNVTIHLNGNEIETHENETYPGHFISNVTILPVGESNLNVTIQPVPNIVPGNYAFEIRVLHNDIVIATPSKSSSGGRRYYPTPTPTPTPVNAMPEPTQTAVMDDDTNVSDDNVSEAPQEPDTDNKFLYGLLGMIAVIILIYLYSLHKKQE